MTSQRRLLIEPSDVELLELVCARCGTSLGTNPALHGSIAKRECPNCGERWLVPDSSLSKAVAGLLFGLHQLGAMDKATATFRLKLHIADKDVRDGPPSR